MSDTKYIKNSALAGRDLRVGTHVATGDANGVFEVPAKYADMLVSTPGWEPSENAPQAAASVDPVGSLREVAAAAPPPAPGAAPPPAPGASPGVSPTQLPEVLKPKPPPEAAPAAEPEAVTDVSGDPAPEPEVAPAAEGKGEAEPETEETPDGPALEDKTKPELVAIAEEWGVELTAADKRGKVDDLRAKLDDAIYGEQNNEG